MNFLSLASSSKGNAYILDDGDTKLLLECGLPFKELSKRLGFGLSEIAGCLLSHEHKDHSKSAKKLLDAGIPVYSSYGTAESLDDERFYIIEEKQMFQIGSFDVMPFSVFHDAADPLGFLIRSRRSKKRMIFITDTSAINYKFTNLDFIAVECNYIADILDKNNRLPEKVCERIKRNHMNAYDTLAFLDKLDMSNVSTVYLLHLSDACSDEQFIYDMFSKTFPDIKIVVCKK